MQWVPSRHNTENMAYHSWLYSLLGRTDYKQVDGRTICDSNLYRHHSIKWTESKEPTKMDVGGIYSLPNCVPWWRWKTGHRNFRVQATFATFDGNMGICHCFRLWGSTPSKSSEVGEQELQTECYGSSFAPYCICRASSCSGWEYSLSQAWLFHHTVGELKLPNEGLIGVRDSALIWIVPFHVLSPERQRDVEVVLIMDVSGGAQGREQLKNRAVQLGYIQVLQKDLVCRRWASSSVCSSWRWRSLDCLLPLSLSKGNHSVWVLRRTSQRRDYNCARFAGWTIKY